MATLTVTYASAGSKFDRAYYSDKHIPLVHSVWDSMGLERLEYSFGEAALGGGPSPFHCIATLTFGSRETLDAAVGAPGAASVFGDIPHFTDAAPVAMIGIDA